MYNAANKITPYLQHALPPPEGRSRQLQSCRKIKHLWYYVSWTTSTSNSSVCRSSRKSSLMRENALVSPAQVRTQCTTGWMRHWAAFPWQQRAEFNTSTFWKGRAFHTQMALFLFEKHRRRSSWQMPSLQLFYFDNMCSIYTLYSKLHFNVLFSVGFYSFRMFSTECLPTSVLYLDI